MRLPCMILRTINANKINKIGNVENNGKGINNKPIAPNANTVADTNS